MLEGGSVHRRRHYGRLAATDRPAISAQANALHSEIANVNSYYGQALDFVIDGVIIALGGNCYCHREAFEAYVDVGNWDKAASSPLYFVVIDDGVVRVAAPQFAPSPAPAKDARFLR